MLQLRGPVTVTLELTNTCFTGPGSGCPVDGNLQNSSLPLEDWEKVIDSLVPYSHEYHVKGAEPLAHEVFAGILKKLDSTGSYFYLHSNGLWFDSKQLFSLLENCAHLGCLIIALHTHDPVIRGITGTENSETYQKLAANIRSAVEAGFPTAVNCILSSDTLPHLDKIADFSASQGVRYTVFSRFGAPGGMPHTPEPAALLQACVTIDSLKRQGYPVMLDNCFPCCFYPSTTAGCHAGITTAAVDFSGNLKPCLYSSVIGGNLLREPVTRAWRSKPMTAWRKKAEPECRGCTRLGVCPGGCKTLGAHEATGRDPLINQALLAPGEPQVLEVTLKENFRPISRYRMRDEDFGWILIRGGSVIPVNASAGKILKAINEGKTLGEIRKKCGDAALSFIYSLYLREFIEFNQEAAPS